MSELERLREILDAYGGDPQRWPEGERERTLALVARSGEAQRLRAAALQLDNVLDLLPAAAPSANLEDRIVAVARTSNGQTRPRATVHPIATARPRSSTHRLRARILAGALPLAAAAALALWLSTGHTPQQIRTTTSAATVAAPIEEIALADLGAYETPGDELLEAAVMDDVYGADPWNGCSDGQLGCVQLETLPLEPTSRDDVRNEEVRFLS